MKKRKKWKVISLAITEPFQIVNFDLRLAKHVKQCIGIRLSVVESPSNFPSKIRQIGIVSISFNRRTRFPLQYMLDFNKDQGQKKESITLNQKIYSSNGGNQGYYIDTGRFQSDAGTFAPYTVKIYLELEIEEK